MREAGRELNDADINVTVEEAHRRNYPKIYVPGREAMIYLL